MRRLAWAFLAVATLGGATWGGAQASSTPSRPNRRWEFSWTFGGSSGGAAATIMGAMSAAGFNSTLPAGCFIWCWSDRSHPWSDGGGPTSMLALSYAIRPWWSLRLQQTSADVSATFGYHATSGWLSLQQSVNSFSVLAVVRAEGLHLGGGPALHQLTITRDGQERGSQRNKLGLTFHGGLSIPARSRVFADLVVQYQLAGSVDIGPYATSDATATMARTRASFSYRTIKLGMGVRI